MKEKTRLNPEKLFERIKDLKASGVTERIIRKRIRAGVNYMSLEAEKLERQGSLYEAMSYRLWSVCLAHEISDEHSFVTAQIKRASVLYEKLPPNAARNNLFDNEKLKELNNLLTIEVAQINDRQTEKNTENELRRHEDRLNSLDMSPSLLRKNFTSIDGLLEEIRSKAKEQNNSLDSKVQRIAWKTEQEKQALEIWNKNLQPEIIKILKPETQHSGEVAFENEEFKKDLIKVLQLLAASPAEYINEILNLVEIAKTYFEKSKEVFKQEEQKEAVEKIRAEGEKYRRDILKTLLASLGNADLELATAIDEIKKAYTVLYRTDVEEELYEGVANWLIEKPVTVLREKAWNYEKMQAAYAPETDYKKKIANYQIELNSYYEIKKNLRKLNGLISDLNNKESTKEEVKSLLQAASDRYAAIESRLDAPVKPIKEGWWKRLMKWLRK